MASLQVDILPAFNDNYIYLLHETASGTVAVVDPGTAAPVIDVLQARSWTLDMILLTHHHHDHIGGAEELRRLYRAVTVGPAGEAQRITMLDRGVAEGDTVDVGTSTGRVIETPGHTRGHIAFWFPDDHALFCGDTLFALGCGRLFEGTPEQMWDSLGKLRALPDDTRVYCGHEYTQNNARFALTVEPDNAELQARAREIDEARRRGEPTIPFLLGEDKRTNPFLRADHPELHAATGMPGDDPAGAFASVRRRKDSF
jgi:hydroxyacylglutathione hydrolase